MIHFEGLYESEDFHLRLNLLDDFIAGHSLEI